MADTRSTRTTAAGVQFDGLYNKIPGFTSGNVHGDREPFILSGGLVNLYGGSSTSGAAANNYLMPCDYMALSAWMNCSTAPGTAAATINIGTLADSGNNNILADYSIATSVVTGWADLTATTAFTTADIPAGTTAGAQGDIIVFGTNGNATATGKAIFGCVLLPN